MQSDPQLRRWYNDFNLRYWSGELPADTVLYWEPVPSGYADCNQPDPEGEFVVRINPALFGWRILAKLTLLHEMAHIRCWPYRGHGAKFDREIQRLLQFKSIRKLI